ncbi:MAG: reactive intermediate/imine deaminase [Acidobacteria bacterium]|nr:MAG: reactive intermediate/imine deaminase [Acidobacteriota bacterium]
MRKIISTPDAPEAIGPYSQAIQANGFVFISGQIPVNPKTKQIVEGGVAEQAEQVIKNLDAVLKAAGSGLDQVVRTTVYLKDMAEFAVMNAVYERFFPQNAPARSTFEVVRLPKDVRIEIDAIAVAG